LKFWEFSEFKSSLGGVIKRFPTKEALAHLARIGDYLPAWDTGMKDRGMLLHILREYLNAVLDRVEGENGFRRISRDHAGQLDQPDSPDQVLVVDARGFKAEGIDPLQVLSCFLDHAHRKGWRRFIVYRVGGQRGVGMGMGSGLTFDTTVDVFGSPGEYCGAFNMGALVRVHNHAQNFTGMVMHSGTLEIHGDAGKVTGYSAKGGTFNILGNVVDRGWVCAVSDPRGPGLEVNVVGTAYEHLCQALMGGSLLMLGLYRGYDGGLRRMDSPYKGAKILAGASAGEVIFFDPKGRIDKAQYGACVERPVDDKKWEDVLKRLMKLEDLYNLGFSRENGHLTVCIDGEVQAVTPDRFRWILPTATLEGYH
jgi:glutamate synthase domain-containing protein 3